MRMTGLILCVLMLAGAALGQQRTYQTETPNQNQNQGQTGAPARSLQGNTFTGYVIGRDTANDTITLESTTNNKSQTLTVSLTGGCQAQGTTGAPMHATDIAQGAKLVVNYMAVAQKGGTSKQATYRAIGFELAQQQNTPAANRTYYACGVTASR